MAEKTFIVKNGLKVTAGAVIDSGLSVGGTISGEYLGFDSDLAQKTTSSLTEDSATNLYYTTARADSAFDVRFLTKTTDSLSEGDSDLYYTQARVDSAIDQRVDSAYVALHFKSAVTLADSQSLTNKTLVSPTINTSILFDSGADIFSQAVSGLSVNEDVALGGANNTTFTFGAQDASKGSVIAVGVPAQFHTSLRTEGDADSNVTTLGFESVKTTFRIANNTGTSPITDGNSIVEITKGGVTKFHNTTEASDQQTAAIVLTGGLGVEKNIRGEDIIAANDIQAVGGKLKGTLDSGSLATLTTDLLSEGDTNLYYLTSRFDSDLDSATTDKLSEGDSNLYYTTARADSAAKHALVANFAGGLGKFAYSEDSGKFTVTGVSVDSVRAQLVGHTGVTYDSSTGQISIGQAVGTSDSVEFAKVTSSGDVVIQGNLTVTGTQSAQSQTDLSVSNAYITVADSNQGDAVDIGIVGSYSDDGGTTIRRTGFVRDASNKEWYVFDNLVQDTIDSDPRAQTINLTDSTVQLPTFNFGKLRGSYLGFDSDFAAFSSNYVVNTSGFTAVNAGRYALDTSGGSFTVTLPANPSTGDYVRLIDVANYATNSVTVARNGSTIEGFSDDFELDLGQSIIEFIYINSNWQIYSSIGQRGPKGDKGDSADRPTFATKAQAIAFTVALG